MPVDEWLKPFLNKVASLTLLKVALKISWAQHNLEELRDTHFPAGASTASQDQEVGYLEAFHAGMDRHSPSCMQRQLRPNLCWSLSLLACSTLGTKIPQKWRTWMLWSRFLDASHEIDVVVSQMQDYKGHCCTGGKA